MQIDGAKESRQGDRTATDTLLAVHSIFLIVSLSASIHFLFISLQPAVKSVICCVCLCKFPSLDSGRIRWSHGLCKQITSRYERIYRLLLPLKVNLMTSNSTVFVFTSSFSVWEAVLCIAFGQSLTTCELCSVMHNDVVVMKIVYK